VTRQAGGSPSLLRCGMNECAAPMAMKPPLPPWAGNDAAHRRTNQRISLLPAEYPTASRPGKFHLIGKNNFPIYNADAGPMFAFGGMQGTGLFMRRISRWRLSFDAVARNCRSNGLMS